MDREPKRRLSRVPQRSAAVDSTHLRLTHALFALLAMGLAAASLVGWAMHVPVLTLYIQGRPALAPMTALVLLVAAAAALALYRRPSAARLLSVVQTLCGLCIVAGHLMGMPATSLLRREWWSSPITGGLFALSGLAGVLLAGRHVTAGQILSFAVLMFAGLVGLGHVFPDADLYRVMPGTGVAIPTVLAFVAVSASQLLACQRAGVVGALTSRNMVGRFGRLLLLAGSMGVLLLAATVILARRAMAFDAETAALLVAWGAIAVFCAALWALAVAVDRAEIARVQAERERDEMRQLVAAAVTHDLRSPLQTASVSATVLQRLVVEPQAVAAVQRLQRSNRRLDRLLRSLLDTLALDAGRSLRLKPSQLELHALVADVIAENESALGERVAWTGAAEGWWDRDALFRVVENLLLNAVKYGDRASPVWCRIDVAPGNHVTITVENQGPSIDPADWDAIFQPFARGRGAGDTQQAGWGVGLAFAKSVAIEHGGDVRLVKSDQQATRFVLLLPLDARPFAQAAPIQRRD
ncbi:sensor histidine kinase [Pseudorhodoferax sp.]|uniref:sensor histidine kinase n=1 Tax=Pseudorhodoferax sp. TaxID=1993553 RepID=UPI002DD629BB|nr:HAMP domain-containing sensor histidine kinase [Pseudorhodoferax sp.]